MYVNKCIKCGREFETKNPKRVICPDCLYPDKSMMITGNDELNGYSAGGAEEPARYYSAGGNPEQNYNKPKQFNKYNNNRPQGGYRQNNNRYNNQGRPQQNNRQGGFNKNKRQGGFNRGQQRRPQMRKAPKQLLVSKEQLEQIELLYKQMLPLPNPDCHEVIGEKIGLEPRKVFFGINLVRQKMMLPKLPFPKRKLAISPDQLFAIKNLYEPLLPLPPIGCHKIIASQLKMDEWRVHVGIGLIRSQMGLGRWNEDRPDIPEEFKKQPAEEVKPKRGRKKKSEETAEE